MKRAALPLFPLAAMLLAGCPGVYFNTTFNAEKAHAQALKLRAERLEKNPEDTVAVTGDERAKLNRAVTKASKVLELWPNDPVYAPRAVFLIAESQFLMEDYPSAAIKYEEYLRYFPDGEHVPMARVRLARSLYLDGKRQAAREALDVVLASEPRGEIRREALLLAARMRIDEQAGAEGLAVYEQLLEEGAFPSPEGRNEARWRAAVIASEIGEWERARAFALAASEGASVPARTRMRNHRMGLEALLRLGRHAEALEESRELLSRREYRPYRPDLKVFEARALEGTGDWPGAARLFGDAAKSAPRSAAAAEALYRLGSRLLDVERRDDSARVLFDSAAAAGRTFEYGAMGADVAAALKRLAELRAIDSAARAPVDTTSDTTAVAVDAEPDEDRGSRSPAPKGKQAEAGKKPAPPPKPESVHHAPFMIAELFQYRLPRPDSARAWLYRVVADTAEDTTYSRRAFYALAWLEREHFGERERSDSLYRVLIARYPGTEWAKQAERNLGLPPTVQTPDDKARALLLEAERRRHARENVLTRVMPAYQRIVDEHPETRDAARAMFALAFLAEERALARPGEEAADSARATYEAVRDRFPGTPQAQAAETWLAAFERARQDPESESPGRGRDEQYEEEEHEEDETRRPRVEHLDPTGEQDLY